MDLSVRLAFFISFFWKLQGCLYNEATVRGLDIEDAAIFFCDPAHLHESIPMTARIRLTGKDLAFVVGQKHAIVAVFAMDGEKAIGVAQLYLDRSFLIC